MLGSVAAGVLAVAVALGGIMWFTGSDDPQTQSAPAEVEVDDGEVTPLSELTEADTHATIDHAVEDPDPSGSTDGTVVHPTETTAVYDEPGGERVAKLEPQQINDTWVPVIDEQDGWVQVMLASRPNTSVGWIPDENLEQAFSPYEIHVHLESMELRLLENGQEVDSWEIGIGRDDAPTPTGRTFLMGQFTDENQEFSDIILPLGSHSDTLDDFGGGPGTVAIHTWPTDDVLGTRSSEGCIRISQQALDRLAEVPLGTVVQVDDQ